ncbi:MAG: glycosyl hydrolase [Acidobacteriota bacterium]|nr:glycosyl hydrolase [Acidobacteriota bacterium]
MKRLFILLICGVIPAAFANEVKLDAAVFGEIKARNIGSATMSGRITDIAGTPDKLYFATASGGLWMTTDGGIAVKQIFEDHTQALGCVTVDPNDPKTIWVGTGEINVRNSTSIGDGVYKSTDGGETWQHMGLADSERIGEIIVHPDNSDVVFVAALGHLWSANEERGLYKSADGGKTWERILGDSDSTGCVDVDLDPQEPDTMYASMWQVRRYPDFFKSGGPGSGMFKSTDGGKTWNEMRNGLPEGDLGRIDIAVAPTRPNRIYAMVESEKTGLYRSDDAGNSWEMVNNDSNMTARPFYLSIIAVDPKDHNRVYNPSFSITVSTDGGKSFGGSMFGGGIHPDFQAIWINPDNPKHVVVGTDGGIYISYDQTKTWRFLTTLPASQFYHVSADNEIPYNVYGGLQDNGSWMAPSYASGGITNAHWQRVGGGDGFHVAADKTDPRYIYWTYQGGQLRRFDKLNGEQKDIRPFPEAEMAKDRYNWNAGFAQSPTSGTIYYGSQYLYRSEDMGDSWKRISDDLTTNDPQKQRQEESGGLTPDNTTAENHCTIFTVAESPKDKNVIWAGTDDGNLQVTTDGGATWTNVVGNVPDLPANTWVSMVEASPHDAATAYVTFDGHRTGDRTPYVYKTTDHGKTWTSLSADNIQSYCHVIRQDYVNPKLLFLGTEMGMYVSLDDGANWILFTGGLPDKAPVKDMVFQQREHDLVIGTHGRGIYIVDDISPIRALTPEVIAENAVLLPARASRTTTSGFGFNYGGSDTFTAQNAPQGLNITYYLKKRHIFGKLRVEIYNDQGELTATLPGGKRRGINRIQWSMRLKPPRVSRSSGLAMGAFLGPMVREGTYTVKLIKGKKTYESKVELLPHRLVNHSPEDRDLQHKTVMELYNAQIDLAFAADSINDLTTQVEDRMKGRKEKSKLYKALNQLKTDMEGLRDTIVDPDNTIFSSKERLRDDVINLYGAVTGYMGRPTANQLTQMETLKGRVAGTLEKFTAMTDLTKINKQLEKAKKDPLTKLDRAEWEKNESQSSGATALPSGKLIRKWPQLMGRYLYPLGF